MKHAATALALCLFSACAATSVAAPERASNETVITFEADSGETTVGFDGSFQVPENRVNPESRMLTIKYVRFPSTSATPGPPIIYLSGGPGGSGIGTAKGERFPLFMAMREFGDVIAIDQRGTGASNDMPTCESSQFDPDETFLSDSDYIKRQKLALAECFDFWASEGIDIHGYNTVQNAADLDAMREHLGADKVSLWGISYGSHLTFAALKSMDDRIDRVVIASGEGLDQTIKQPARTDAYFDRLQTALVANGLRGGDEEHIKTLIARVHKKLDAEPILLSVPQKDGAAAPFLLQRRDLQTIGAALVMDPKWALYLIEIYEGLDNGDLAPAAGLMARWHTPNTPISYRAMPIATDLASGTGPERRAMLSQQAETALLGRYMNHEVELEDVDPSLDLGPEFRTDPVSDVPVLLLSGTLDGRTYVESQKEAVSGLTNVSIVTVENAGHNLFMTSPEVTEVIQTFMRGEPVTKTRIVVEIPQD